MRLELKIIDRNGRAKKKVTEVEDRTIVNGWCVSRLLTHASVVRTEMLDGSAIEYRRAK